MSKRFRKRKKAENNFDVDVLIALGVTLALLGVGKMGQFVLGKVIPQNKPEQVQVENISTVSTKENEVNKISHQQIEIPVKEINQKQK